MRSARRMDASRCSEHAHVIIMHRYTIAQQSFSIRIISGIDLMPIKPINNAITLLGDITTEKMRHAAKKELQTWEVSI
jgi:23S rRNA U2552 (ribose-2'-O)-methylase RlmE/FtsJ